MIWRSYGVQKRLLHALVMRETLTRYGRRNLGFLWLFIEPMLFTLGIAALWSATKTAHGPNTSVLSFAITGYSSVLLWRNCANRCTHAVEPNLALLYHRNVRLLDVFLSRLILEVFGATVSFCVLLSAFGALELIPWPQDCLLLITGWGLLALFAAGLGLVVGSLSERSESFDRLWHTITYLLFPLSGAVFMLDWLPRQAREVVSYIPIVHGVEMIRHGYYGATVVTHESPWFLLVTAQVLLAYGLWLIQRLSREVEPE